MKTWTVSAMGAYPLPYSEDLLRELVCEPCGKTVDTIDPGELTEQCDFWREQARDNMQGLHLIELAIQGDLVALPIAVISQDAKRSDSSQVPYDEQWLNDDGTAPMKYAALTTARSGRLAFWLHFVDPSKGLHGPWGHVALPAPTPMPQRLKSIIKYSLP